MASNCPSRQRTRMSHWAGAWALNSVVSIATAPACSDFAGTAAQMKKTSSDSNLTVSTFSAPLINFSHASGSGTRGAGEELAEIRPYGMLCRYYERRCCRRAPSSVMKERRFI